MAEKLFTEFPPVSTQDWEKVIEKDLKGADYNKKLVWKTDEGNAVQRYYRHENLKDLSHLGSHPGAFPFVRGTKEHNQWLVRQGYCAHENLAEANRQAVDGSKKGLQSIGFCIDGKKELSPGDLATLLQGIDLNTFEINFEGCCCASPKTIENFLAYAKTKNINPRELRASFDFDPLRHLTTKGCFCDNKSLARLKNCVDAAKDYPRVRVIGVEAYAIHAAGADIVQELGFGLAMGSEYMHQLMEQGCKADEAAARIKFTFAVGPNYFMEIAKFRAARMLWANITTAYGATSECSMKMKVHAVTSEWNQTIYDAHVNMLRATTEAMSAAIAGVDSLEVLPFDYAFRSPGAFSNRIARNTQTLLKDEAHFDKVTDPAAGSYYIETLTHSIANEAWKLFRQVEEKGGYITAFSQGFIQGQVKATSQKRDMNIATRRETLLGTNQYPNFTETLPAEVSKDMVSRKTAACTCQSQNCLGEPLVAYRGAQAFELLRYTTEKSGKTPKVFMLTFGNLAMCRARAQFACNFFAVAGFQVMDNNRFATTQEGVAAAIAAKADIVVACAADEDYAQGVLDIAAQLGNQGIVVVAGEPVCKADLEAAGISHFISVKSNVLTTLQQYQQELGLA